MSLINCISSNDESSCIFGLTNISNSGLLYILSYFFVIGLSKFFFSFSKIFFFLLGVSYSISEYNDLYF